GDEFAVLLEDVDGPREVEALARKINGVFQEPFQVGERQVAITTSIGITVCPPDSSDAGALLNNAESALKEAKQQGKNTFRFVTPSILEEIHTSYELEAGLKSAVKLGQFVVLYQPQVRLADHRIEAVEALLHWKHPERGLLSPGDFVSLDAPGEGSAEPGRLHVGGRGERRHHPARYVDDRRGVQAAQKLGKRRR